MAATALLLATGTAQAATGWAVSDVFTLDTRGLSAPTGLTASDGTYTDKIRVTWNAVSEATNYLVYRNTADQSSSSSLLTATNTAGADDKTALAGVTYYFWVKAQNALTNSAFSESNSGWRRSKTTQVVGDYDGDGLADPATYDPATSNWIVRLSSAGYAPLELLGFLGGPDFVPACADYDGDRRTDPGVYAETNGEWIVLLSAFGYQRLDLPGLLGGPGQSPAPADYDGDRKAAPAVYAETNAEWQVMLSSQGYSTLALPGLLGGTGYAPAPADYDGDGFADPAVYAEATGDWIFLLSLYDYYRLEKPDLLGGPGFTAVPADYDGDAFADPAVYNETTGEWRVLLSSQGYQEFSVVL
ncbi:MAG: fibronectin type III domain-containing protein [Lentisphaerae bacterium]|nr:fibronectin type III domain-containing protein [Lentisphaerota bacterium]